MGIEDDGEFREELSEWAGAYEGRTVDASSLGISLKPKQDEVYSSDARFRVLVAGRRFGKSFLAVPELLRMAAGTWKDGSDREAWYVAPTYKQARRDLWRPLKRLAA